MSSLLRAMPCDLLWALSQCCLNKSPVTVFAFPTLPARWGLDCSRFPVWLWPEPCFRPQAAERRIILLSASYCGRSGHFPIAVPRSLRVRGTAGLAMRSKVCVRGRRRCSRTRFWSIAFPFLCVQVLYRIASSVVLPLLERSCSCLRVSLVSCVAARCVQCPPLALHAVWPTC